jgi:HK97 family phage prohead protease
MPAITREQSFQFPTPGLSAGPRVLVASGIYDGNWYLYGRAVTYNTRSANTGASFRSMLWPEDPGILLTDGHDGPLLGRSMWIEETSEGLDVVFRIEANSAAETAVMARVMSGDADLSIGAITTHDPRVGLLHEVALVDEGAFPGTHVLGLLTPYDQFTWQDGELRYAGVGPHAAQPWIEKHLGNTLEPEFVAERGALESALVPFQTLEIRRDGGQHTLTGICVPYDRPTNSAGPVPEVFRAGAFSNLSSADRTRLFDFNHDTNRRPVGIATRFEERAEGLYGQFRFYDTPAGRGAFEEVVEETYGGLSIGFVATKENRSHGMREILGAKLHHVSLVDVPAYEDARILDVA